jgi:hypothetical protein
LHGAAPIYYAMSALFVVALAVRLLAAPARAPVQEWTLPQRITRHT